MQIPGSKQPFSGNNNPFPINPMQAEISGKNTIIFSILK